MPGWLTFVIVWGLFLTACAAVLVDAARQITRNLRAELDAGRAEKSKPRRAVQ